MDKLRALVAPYMHPTMMYKIEKDFNVKSKPFPKAIQIWAYDRGEQLGGSPFTSITQCVNGLKRLCITKSFGPLIDTGKLYKARYTFYSKSFKSL
jgi:hypothetical protein